MIKKKTKKLAEVLFNNFNRFMPNPQDKLFASMSAGHKDWWLQQASIINREMKGKLRDARNFQI